MNAVGFITMSIVNIQSILYNSFSLLDITTIFSKLPSKILITPTIGENVCAYHFVYITERFEQKSTAFVYS